MRAVRDPATHRVELAAGAAVGAALFFLVHAVVWLAWQRVFPDAVLETAWFLGSRRAVRGSQLALAIVAALWTGRRAWSWRRRLVRAVALEVGFLAAAAAAFAALGPERLMQGPVRLWPMVLVSALLLTAPAVLAGTLLAALLAPPRGR